VQLSYNSNNGSYKTPKIQGETLLSKTKEPPSVICDLIVLGSGAIAKIITKEKK
jgi:hypothetical protein